MRAWTRMGLAVLVAAGLVYPGRAAERQVSRPTRGLRVVEVQGRAAQDSFTFSIDAPKVSVVPGDDGFAEVRAEGFDVPQTRAGYPDLPGRVILVAIPPDATPRLVVRPEGQAWRMAARPRPVPRAVPEAQAGGEFETTDETEQRLSKLAEAPVSYVPALDPQVYEGATPWPPAPAWLGRVGVLRDQRYVELHLAPVRFEGAAGSLVVEPAMEITVYFDDAGRSSGIEAPPSRFESVYRNAFANYAQGRQFRLGHDEALLPLEQPAEPTDATASIGPIRRVVVHQDGPVRLDYSYFQTQAPEFLTYDPTHWRLTGRGSAVPLQVQQSGGNPALLEPGEWIQFYGERADDEAETMLHWQGEIDQEWLYETNDFTDDNVYFLTVDSLPQPPMSTRDATPTGQTPAASHTAVAHAEVDDQYWPISGELWFWSPPLTLSQPTQTKNLALPGLLSGTAPAQVRARFRGFSSCLTVDPDHVTKIGLKDNTNATVVLPASNPNNVGNQNVAAWDGTLLFTQEFAWVYSSGPVLTNPLNVTLQVASVAGCSNDDVLPDWVEIAYQRTFAAQSDALTFDWPDGNAEFQITGFSTSAPQIYEVTNLLPGGALHDAIRLTGATVTPAGPNFTVRFHITNDPSLPDGTARHFVVAGSSGVTVPAAADFKSDRVSTLISDTSHADLVAIVHPDLVSSHCSTGGNACSYDVDCTGGASDRCQVDAGTWFGMLLAQRQSEGLTTRVARIGDVYDEFGGGMPGPNAIKSFLAWIWSGGWAGPAPSFVLLVGDGSYDYKGGTAKGNYVPTPMIIKEGNPTLPFYSSDNLLAAVSGGDSLPEMSVGRITARTLGEAEAVFQKLVNYEQLPASGSWKSTAIVVSDRGKEDTPNHPDPYESLQFEAINDIAVNMLAGTAYTPVRLRYWSDYCPGGLMPCNAAAIKGDMKGLVNGSLKACALTWHKCATNAECTGGAGDTCNPIDGAALFQFTGHGNFDLWSDDKIFCGNNLSGFCTPDDTEQLFNGGRLPWLMANNCLTGGFHGTSLKSMGEQWLKRVGGGAVAVLAPSGLGFRFLGESVTQHIWGDLFGPEKIRDLATPVMDSLVYLCSQGGSPEGCEFYTLLGDPATQLQLPSVQPASNLTAQASTGPTAQVSLSWSASPQSGVGYFVYRATQAGGTYTKLNANPIGGTNYQDTAPSASLTQTYYYYVVAAGGGFESAWSNFNSDCSAQNPIDCVKATPLNLVPPATPPTPVVTDLETGGKLLVSWTPNPEPDVWAYEVHFGKTPAMTEPFQLAGTAAGVVMLGLDNDTTYYFAIRALNTSGTHSALSGTATGVPRQIQGVKAPKFISSLRLTKSGTNALLTWGAVTTDIYGKAETVASYEVYRGTTVNFVPGPATLRGTTAVPSFIDTGALGVGGPNYYYLVRAIDVDGNPGGLGQELPNGIGDLRLGWTGNGNLSFSWTPVTLDFDGEPTVITHYDLYSADHAFTRADIRDGLIPLAGSVTGTTLVMAPPAGNRYYSVLAVDARGNKSPF